MISEALGLHVTTGPAKQKVNKTINITMQRTLLCDVAVRLVENAFVGKAEAGAACLGQTILPL